MPINSMTGFARTEGSLGDARWYWEVRSVNGRGLDIRLRLPPGMEALEQNARAEIGRHVVRGHVSANLNLQTGSQSTQIQLNKENLSEVIAAAQEIGELIGNLAISIESVIQARGVLEIAERAEDDDLRTARQNAIFSDLTVALGQLRIARATEGAELSKILCEQVDEVASLTNAAQSSTARTPEAIKAKICDQIGRLSQAIDMQLDPQRLHQEAMLLATKADIAEELDRLRAHITSARDLISVGSPVGRKLDFLVQEFNREANTLCSKANHIEITKIGLQMKATIDQFREQVQNVE